LPIYEKVYSQGTDNLKFLSNVFLKNVRIREKEFDYQIDNLPKIIEA